MRISVVHAWRSKRRHRAVTTIAGEPGRLILERCTAVRIEHRRWFNVLVSLFGGRLRPGKAQSTSTGGPAEDDAIITALYQQYRGPLMTFVMRLTAGNRQQAEDVVQETMVRAWREAGRLDLSEASLMPWLTTVARRIVIDDHRRKQA